MKYFKLRLSNCIYSNRFEYPKLNNNDYKIIRDLQDKLIFVTVDKAIINYAVMRNVFYIGKVTNGLKKI